MQTDKTLFLDESYHDPEIELTKSATSTKDDNDEEFDDNELSKIKDFLEETVSELLLLKPYSTSYTRDSVRVDRLFMQTSDRHG